MPSAAEILASLATISHRWQTLAVLWHVYFGLLAAAAIFGWRPPGRLAGALLIPPIASVSVLAWMQGNPFNSTLIGMLSVALVVLLRKMSAANVILASPLFVVLALLLFGFGWVYPHFFGGDAGAAYWYAAPLGLIPCPTFLATVGAAIIFRGFGCRPWSVLVASVALFYGLFGALYLGVTVDWILVGGAVVLLMVVMQHPEGGSNPHPVSQA
jgi:hypothetical protein